MIRETYKGRKLKAVKNRDTGGNPRPSWRGARQEVWQGLNEGEP